jgi:hypothetical protein
MQEDDRHRDGHDGEADNEPDAIPALVPDLDNAGDHERLVVVAVVEPDSAAKVVSG